MALPRSFYPYNPIRFRLAFLAAGLVCAALTAWAVWNSVRGTEPMGEARAGLSAGLMFAFFFALVRLRPRPGWGVEVEPLRLVISKPFRGEPTKLLWSEITQVLRGGTRRDHLLLFLENGGRLLLSAHLFAKRADFESLYATAIERVPPQKLDA